MSAVDKVPEEYFKEDFRLKPEFFRNESRKEASAKIEL